MAQTVVGYHFKMAQILGILNLEIQNHRTCQNKGEGRPSESQEELPSSPFLFI